MKRLKVIEPINTTLSDKVFYINQWWNEDYLNYNLISYDDFSLISDGENTMNELLYKLIDIYADNELKNVINNVYSTLHSNMKKQKLFK